MKTPQENQTKSDPLKPQLALLVKLGSIVVHAQEFIDTDNEFDRIAMIPILDDPEVKRWIDNMGVYLPLMRD
jgi:hypothetical protein